jgi:hypothetical protein
MKRHGEASAHMAEWTDKGTVCAHDRYKICSRINYFPSKGRRIPKYFEIIV